MWTPVLSFQTNIHIFFHTEKIQDRCARNLLQCQSRSRQLTKLGKPSAFGLHLSSNAGALEVNSGENLPFLVCFFTIREYRALGSIAAQSSARLCVRRLPLIEVKDLTKSFGERTAVDHVSFVVNRGEILGFLGPNGAGKTTTMRILTGFLPATSGTAQVAGFDVFNDSLEVRKRIGYLPENPPLYLDMSVSAYLEFVARIKNVPAEKRQARVDDAMAKTNITDKRHELIKRLSRGYKQRVGLAQALVHDPEVIILDEPTVGLDPKQIIEVRHLIKGLAGSHTIILSTHILPEVSMTCDRVVIINRGRIAAIDTPANLTQQLKGGQNVLLEVAADQNAVSAAVREIPGVRKVTAEPAGGNGRVALMVEVSAGQDVRSQIAARIVGKGWPLYELRGVNLSLEEIFLELTTEDSEHAEAISN
jgi:ABC-2 type transport system ATP-binding protein